MIEVIYCADGNKRFASLSLEAGFTYGAQLPNTVYYDPEFVDQNWNAPDLDRYIKAVAAYVEIIIIIPKVRKGIEYLPRTIGGVPVRLGYSIPTSFSRTYVNLTEFLGWPIHLLGGSPIVQSQLAGLHINGNCLIEAPRLNVASVDGNYHQLMATKYNQFFVPDGSARYAKNRFWPTLKEADGQKWGDGSSKADAPYEAFRRSCQAIMEMWREGAG